MPDSKKPDDKATSKKTKKQAKEESKKKLAADKKPLYNSKLTVFKSGTVPKGTIVTQEDVQTHLQAKVKAKPKKPIPSAVYRGRIEFKSKIVSGDRNKKVLRYDCIKLLEQLSADSRMVFVQFEKPKNGHFLILGFSEMSHTSDFINAVYEFNEAVQIRRPVEEMHNGRRTDDSNESLDDVESSPRSMKKRDHRHDESQSVTRTATPRSHRQNGKDSFVFADKNATNRRSSSTTSSSSSSSVPRNSSKSNVRQTPSFYPERRDELPDESDRKSSLITKYLYIGPSDEEDSYIEMKQRAPSSRHSHKGKKHTKSNNYYHRSNTREENSVSMSTPTLDMAYADDFGNERGYERGVDNLLKPMTMQLDEPRRRSQRRRSHPRRPKSRELPLSEAETKRGGWHSDIMFLTPTKDGGAKVSADGPVMLYTATRANVPIGYTSSSEESSSDEEGDLDWEDILSCSSGSTLTLDEGEEENFRRDDLLPPVGNNYGGRGRRQVGTPY